MSRHRRAWRWAASAAVVGQLLVLYWPSPQAPGAAVPGLDWVVHALVFGAVAYAGRRSGLAAGPLVAVLLAHAVVSEVVQGLVVPGRSGDWRDAVADAVGTVLGASAAARGRVARRPRSRRSTG